MDRQPWKSVIFVVVLLVPLLWLGVVALRNPARILGVVPPGPVSCGHKGLNCTQCHNEPWRVARKALGTDGQGGGAMDRACAECHGGLREESFREPRFDLRAGLVVRPPSVKPHSETQLHSETPGCADCHKEHRGQQTVLAATERDCTACHADLHTEGGAGTFHKTITGFGATGHPPFGRWRPAGLTDPAVLAFNHAAHLNLKAEVLKGIATPLERLKRQECAFCHEPDPKGLYMQPVRYERHCAECHPLAVQLTARTLTREAQAAAREFAAQPVPHVQPAGVRAALRERLFRTVQQQPEVLRTVDDRAPGRPLPGRTNTGEVLREPAAWVAWQLRETERQQFDGAGGCRYCHSEKAPFRRNLGLPRYEPTAVRERWFPHGKFSHAKHGLLRCVDCHDALASTRTSDVLMPKVENCAACHDPRQQTPAGRRQARGDCLECHRYHSAGGP